MVAHGLPLAPQVLLSAPNVGNVSSPVNERNLNACQLRSITHSLCQSFGSWSTRHDRELAFAFRYRD
jgi:hypothetical protein